MKYEYSKAKKIVDNFFWSTFCDNYLEIVKKRVYQGEGDAKLSAQYTLYSGLFKILKMWAPIVPFITEEVYQNHYREIEKGKSIHLSEWPKISVLSLDNEKLNETEPVGSFEKGKQVFSKWGLIIDLIVKVRQEKSNAQKAMNAKIKLSLPKSTVQNLEGAIEDLKNVTGAVEIAEGEFGIEFVEKAE